MDSSSAIGYSIISEIRHKSDTDPILANELANVRFFFQMLIIPMVVSIGIIANLFNVVVLVRMHTPTSYYLATLAVYDLLYLLMNFLISPRAKASSLHVFLMQQEWFAEFLTWIIPSSIAVSNAATWLICAFSFERFDIFYSSDAPLFPSL